MLRDDVGNLATHFRAHGETTLADALDGTLNGPEDRLPRRVLAIFTHGMGGLMDTPLYTNGRVDAAVTQRRDELAHALYESARAALS